MRIWRISNFTDLTGRGGLLAAGRWNILGTPIVYCADHPATDLLEMLVHFDLEDLPGSYRLLEIGVPEDIEIEMVDLPQGWETNRDVTRNIWQAFCDEGRGAVLQVPSAILPQASNFLINPQHLDSGRITVVEIHKNDFDKRLDG